MLIRLSDFNVVGMPISRQRIGSATLKSRETISDFRCGVISFPDSEIYAHTAPCDTPLVPAPINKSTVDRAETRQTCSNRACRRFLCRTLSG